MEKALVVAFSGHSREGSLTALMASRQKYCVSVRPDSETGTISAVLLSVSKKLLSPALLAIHPLPTITFLSPVSAF